MKIYIASSWKNQHAVEMLTKALRDNGDTVYSFVENNMGENVRQTESFEEWLKTEKAANAFLFDTHAAMTSDAVIYIGPSGCDAWSEVGIAWASDVPILGLWTKGEPVGLMRNLVAFFTDYRSLLSGLQELRKSPRMIRQWSITRKMVFVTEGVRAPVRKCPSCAAFKAHRTMRQKREKGAGR